MDGALIQKKDRSNQNDWTGKKRKERRFYTLFCLQQVCQHNKVVNNQNINLKISLLSKDEKESAY